jgi:multidrug efflux pump subunit AcrB
MTTEQKHLGLAGQLAQSFIRSKLTVLMVVASLAFGLVATLALPREEEPQINVPMFDVFVGMPGASAREVEERLINTGERKFWEIPDVEYVYSTAEAGRAMFILRFKVGTDPEEAMTRVYTKTFANQDFLPPGATSPLVKPRSIDDVPILALDLTGGDAFALRRQAAALRQEISAVPGVSETEIIGGHRRQFLVHFDPAAVARRRLTPLELAGALQAANTRLPAGTAREGDRVVAVETDARVRTAEDLKRIVVGVSGGVPVTVADVARVTDGPDEDERFVSAWTKDREDAPAVTLAVSKRRGQNATRVAEEVLHRVDASRSALLAPETQIAVTRNYGETAKEKSDELLFHMALATLSVTILIAFFLGAREALVVLIAIPVTLALTLLVYYLLGYTLNRITLFALIFSIGILVDDAIVVVENIHRHFAMKDGRSIWRLSVDAVAEVGNPTILATWAVIAAILPMAFVSGLMGPYMRPIPVGASVAMLFSLGIAFVISPWAFAHILEWWKPKNTGSHGAGESALDRLYRRFMGRLLSDAKARWAYLGGMVVLLLASFALVYFKAVTVKMLPFDNKNEFEVVLTLPEGSAVERTKAAADDIARVLLKNPHVGTRHLLRGRRRALQLQRAGAALFPEAGPPPGRPHGQFKPQEGPFRPEPRHRLGASPEVQAVADRYGARVQVAEVPPGPPVLSTLVFEIYGPDNDRRDQFARDLQAYLRRGRGRGGRGHLRALPRTPADPGHRPGKGDLERPAGVGGWAKRSACPLAGQTVGLAHTNDKEPVEIRLRLPVDKRAGLSGVQDVALMSRNGTMIPPGAPGRGAARRERPAHLPQEPPAGQLRHRRRGRPTGKARSTPSFPCERTFKNWRGKRGTP